MNRRLIVKISFKYDWRFADALPVGAVQCARRFTGTDMMSDTSQGHGWWQATDGRWYPPESHPGFRPSPSLPQTSTAVLPPPVQSYTQFAQPVAAGPRKRKKPLWRRWWVIVIALFVALMVIMAIAAPPEDEGTSSPAADEASGTPAAADAPQAPAVETPAVEPAPESNLTPSQQNAVRSAESYLELMGFSRQGLIDQLEFEQYSTSDATFAVDSLTVDWNAEAAESAASYLETMAFSCGSLIDQLEFENFTPEQAAFGAGQTGIC